MRGVIPPLPQYAFMAWCSVKAQGQLYLSPLRHLTLKTTNLAIETSNAEACFHLSQIISLFFIQIILFKVRKIL